LFAFVADENFYAHARRGGDVGSGLLPRLATAGQACGRRRFGLVRGATGVMEHIK